MNTPHFTIVHSVEDLPPVEARPGENSAGYTLPNWQKVGQFRATAWAYLIREDGGAVVFGPDGRAFTAANPPLLPMNGGKRFDRKSAGPNGQVAALIESTEADVRLAQKWADRDPNHSDLHADKARKKLAPLGITIQRGFAVLLCVNGERFGTVKEAVLHACGLEGDALERTDQELGAIRARTLAY